MPVVHARPAVTLEAANRILAAVLTEAGRQGVVVSAAVSTPGADSSPSPGWTAAR